MRKIVVEVTQTFEYDENIFEVNEDGEIDDDQIIEKVFYDLKDIVEEEDKYALNFDIREEDDDEDDDY